MGIPKTGGNKKTSYPLQKNEKIKRIDMNQKWSKISQCWSSTEYPQRANTIWFKQRKQGNKTKIKDENSNDSEFTGKLNLLRLNTSRILVQYTLCTTHYSMCTVQYAGVSWE